jgi:hypothetical protein
MLIANATARILLQMFVPRKAHDHEASLELPHDFGRTPRTPHGRVEYGVPLERAE